MMILITYFQAPDTQTNFKHRKEVNQVLHVIMGIRKSKNRTARIPRRMFLSSGGGDQSIPSKHEAIIVLPSALP